MPTIEAPNKNFQPVSTPMPLGTARVADGTYFNALGLESTETMKHVSVIWQKKCIPLSEFSADIHDQAQYKYDRRLTSNELKLTPTLTLSDGTGFTLSGLKSMPRNAMKQGFVDYLVSDIHNYGNVSDENLDRAKSDLAHYLNLELDHVEANRDEKLSARLEKRRQELTEVTSGQKKRKTKLEEEIADLEQRLQDSKGHLVRTRNDDNGNQVVRYVASERYGIIDNADVMRIIAQALPGGWGDSLASHAWNDGDSMIGNVLLPDYIKNRPDSEYGVGFSFKNSEIGRFRFEICPFLFRAICLNGCIWGRSNSVITIERKHLGNVDLKEIAAQVCEAIKIALAEGEQVLELFDKSKDVEVTNIPALIASLSKEYKLTMAQGRKWLASMEIEPGDTAFHVVQGLTKAAQSFTGDARQTMEEVAGMILAPSLTADIDAIGKQWSKFESFAERLTDDQVEAYALAK